MENYTIKMWYQGVNDETVYISQWFVVIKKQYELSSFYGRIKNCRDTFKLSMV